MRILRLLAPLVLVVLAACGGSKIGTPVSDGDLMQIAEAIMVKQYNLNVPPTGDRHPVIFVDVNGKPPSADFLTRLSKGGARFRPGNEYKPGLGTSLTISNFVWTDSDHAKGDIGEICGPLCGEGHAVVVVFRDGKWNVVSLTPTWIS